MMPSLYDEISADAAQKAWELSRQPEAEELLTVTCNHCKGTGMAGSDPEDICDDCRGEGVVERSMSCAS